MFRGEVQRLPSDHAVESHCSAEDLNDVESLLGTQFFNLSKSLKSGSL